MPGIKKRMRRCVQPGRHRLAVLQAPDRRNGRPGATARQSNRGGLFAARLAAPGANFGAIGEPVVVLRNPEHERLCFALVHAVGDGAHFLAALAPMVGIVVERFDRRGPYSSCRLRQEHNQSLGYRRLQGRTLSVMVDGMSVQDGPQPNNNNAARGLGRNADISAAAGERRASARLSAALGQASAPASRATRTPARSSLPARRD
jgi:hypothetical protein